MPRVVPGVGPTLPDLVIMNHPVPMVPGHRLAVSRRGVGDAAQTGGRADAFWQALAEWWDAEDAAPAVGISNLGERQEVKLLHVHLLPEHPSSTSRSDSLRGTDLVEALAALRRASPGQLTGVTASVVMVRTDVGWEVAVDPSPSEIRRHLPDVPGAPGRLAP